MLPSLTFPKSIVLPSCDHSTRSKYPGHGACQRQICFLFRFEFLPDSFESLCSAWLQTQRLLLAPRICSMIHRGRPKRGRRIPRSLKGKDWKTAFILSYFSKVNTNATGIVDLFFCLFVLLFKRTVFFWPSLPPSFQTNRHSMCKQKKKDAGT